MKYSRLVAEILHKARCLLEPNEWRLEGVKNILAKDVDSLPQDERMGFLEALRDVSYVRLWHCLDTIIDVSDISTLARDRLDVLRASEDKEVIALGVWSFREIPLQKIDRETCEEFLDYIYTRIKDKNDERLERAAIYLIKTWEKNAWDELLRKIRDIELLLFSKVDQELATI